LGGSQFDGRQLRLRHAHLLERRTERRQPLFARYQFFGRIVGGLDAQRLLILLRHDRRDLPVGDQARQFGQGYLLRRSGVLGELQEHHEQHHDDRQVDDDVLGHAGHWSHVL
jgi:hypothetical protein